jgi:hypothetical protein
MDQFTYLHFASGIVAYNFGLSLRDWIVIHTMFEFAENTEIGMKFIRTIKIWPGGKPSADTLVNRLGDTVGTAAGWLSARELDRIGSRRGWFVGHLNV